MNGTRTLLSIVLATGLLAGCGGGERQDENERAGTYTVDVVTASFPERQRLADQSEMTIAVRNTGAEPLPDVAVTVDSFNRRSEQVGLADPSRPVWIVDEGPRGGTVAYTNTWALDALAPGQTKTFKWKVTAVEPGSYEVSYKVAAGLDGKAKAQTADGRVPEGKFSIDVSDEPAASRVDPKTGEVVPDPRKKR